MLSVIASCCHLAPGSVLYEILEPVGAGGMGEVYKARDTRLNRVVAIKKGLAPFNERFEREAQAIASLNHPYICSLFDVGPDYLVMEYVEGRQLAGPLPLDEAVTVAGQILEAIDAAHRKGIVHRDLKPANILVTRSGVKLLDFGLAKASAELAASMATLAGPATGAGAIVGTLHYMSPEQVEARDADVRSDIFAFGLVLYELITGKRPFDGKSSGSIIASILKDQPQPIAELCPGTPKGIDRIVRTCLEKDPDQRWQSARDIKHALDWAMADAAAGRHEPQPVRTGQGWTRVWQGATFAALLVAAAAAGAVLWARRPERAAPAVDAMRFQVMPPPGSVFETYAGLSPDGTRLAFTANDADGTVRLWIRDLSSLDARVLPGTEGAQSLIWSPDSRHIAFGFSSQLKKIAIAGGPPQILCDAGTPVGSGAWSSEGTILFGSRGAGGIKRVSANGGAAIPVTLGEAGVASFPSFLPGEHRFIYFRRTPVQGIFAASIDEKPEQQPTTPVLASEHGVAYVRGAASSAGVLFFVREQTLMVQPFDHQTLSLHGDPMPIDRVTTVNNYPAFSVSTNGRLAYRSGRQSTSQQLTWFDRAGKPLGTVGDAGAHEQLTLSPDAAHAAYRDGLGTVAGDLWVADLVRGVSERFTFERSLGGFPVWSPDGSHIVFRSGDGVFQKAATGGGTAELLMRMPTQTIPSSWSSDGRFVLLTMLGSNTLQDILVLPMQGDRQLFPFVRTQYNESQGRFSPDGRWVAYVSNESGRAEVYIASFTPPGSVDSRVQSRQQISRDGGNTPVWRDDGREVIFRSALSGMPMAVEIMPTGAGFQAGTPIRLFTTPPVPWAVTRDAKRFLVSMPPPQEVLAPIIVDLNWEAGLKR